MPESLCKPTHSLAQR